MARDADTLAAVASRIRIASQRGGFFDAKELGERLEDGRKRCGVTPKDIATHLWPHRKPENALSDWYKKASRTTAAKKFSPAEIDRAAAYLRERNPEVPTLYPVVEWDVAARFDEFAEIADDERRVLQALRAKPKLLGLILATIEDDE